MHVNETAREFQLDREPQQMLSPKAWSVVNLTHLRAALSGEILTGHCVVLPVRRGTRDLSEQNGQRCLIKKLTPHFLFLCMIVCWGKEMGGTQSKYSPLECLVNIFKKRYLGKFSVELVPGKLQTLYEIDWPSTVTPHHLHQLQLEAPLPRAGITTCPCYIWGLARNCLLPQSSFSRSPKTPSPETILEPLVLTPYMLAGRSRGVQPTVPFTIGASRVPYSCQWGGQAPHPPYDQERQMQEGLVNQPFSTTDLLNSKKSYTFFHRQTLGPDGLKAISSPSSYGPTSPTSNVI